MLQVCYCCVLPFNATTPSVNFICECASKCPDSSITALAVTFETCCTVLLNVAVHVNPEFVESTRSLQ
jgi:hypothetical protein